ncbi:MAG: ATP-binding protein [Novosphingobium sp.]
MTARPRPRIGPGSLLGQMLLAVAVALLLVQGIGALLIYRAEVERRESDLLHSAAFRLIAASRGPDDQRPPAGLGDVPRRFFGFHGQGPGPRHSRQSPLLPGEPRNRDAQFELRRILADQGVRVDEVVVMRRAISRDAVSVEHIRRLPRLLGGRLVREGEVLIAAAHLVGGDWLVARAFVGTGARGLVATLLWQTLLIYLVVVGAIALILRRITRPLDALTRRLESFAETRSLEGQLAPEGPGDVRRLIIAHNAMEGRIAALLDEKDVMLGAIGHDLKTPLAALRVRIESVEDDIERGRMATTIEDIVRTLDDILSLARVGRPTDEVERTELSALVAAVVEEFEDMGRPVELGDTTRIALPLRPTWLRRALRNLIGNAVRYGGVARVSLVRVGGFAVIRIEDDGPGIAEGDMARLMDPFTRADPSRNTETGGAGLGLALARAIANQHGGSIALANRRGPQGGVDGLTATLRLPIG